MACCSSIYHTSNKRGIALFQVAKVEFEDNGLSSYHTKYKSWSLSECRAYLVEQALSPTRKVREEAKMMFIFDKTYQLVI